MLCFQNTTGIAPPPKSNLAINLASSHGVNLTMVVVLSWKFEIPVILATVRVAQARPSYIIHTYVHTLLSER